MTADHPNVDPTAEQGVIGALILYPGLIDRMLGQGLRAHRLAGEQLRQVLDAILALHDRAELVDTITVAGELHRVGVPEPRRVTTALASVASDHTTIGAHLKRVLELADLRDLQQAGHQVAEAAQRGDRAAALAALTQLERPTTSRSSTLDPEAWASVLFDHLEAEGDQENVTALPWVELTEAMDGGIRPGDFIVVGGWTGHGKSLVASQILDDAAAAGRSCHLYMTEMTAVQRGLRLLSGRTGISLSRLKRPRKLSPDQRASVIRQLTKLPYGVSIVSDWSMEDVARDIRRGRWDLAVVDHLHDFPYRDERDLAALSGTLLRAAKASTTEHAGTAIVCCVQLNDGQMRDARSPRRPKPGQHSIKGATAIKQAADEIIFVWQEEDENGMVTGDGEIWTAKGRQNSLAAVEVSLDLRHMRFERRGTDTLRSAA